MEKENEIFLDAPNRGFFFNPVPSEGFELVSGRDEIPDASSFFRIDSPFLMSGGVNILFPEHLFEKVQNGSGIALPHEVGEKIGTLVEEIPRKTLLFPKGEVKGERNAFFEEDKEPLFQKFANLKTKEEIQSFAGEYGCLYKNPEWQQDNQGKTIFFLESVEKWQNEINAINIALQAIVIFEEGRFSNFDFRPDMEKTCIRIRPALKSGGTSGWPASFTFLFAPYVEGIPKEKIFKIAVAGLFNEKLQKNPSFPAYGIGKAGEIEPFFHSQSLAAAIWLQLAQSFFKDGPADQIAKRCHICGKWGKAYKEWDDTITLDTDIWGQRRKGPYAGLYYHKLCDKAERMREYRERKAAEEGRELRKRKRTKKLSTD